MNAETVEIAGILKLKIYHMGSTNGPDQKLPHTSMA